MVSSGALAQSQRTAHAMIPFEFWIGGNCLPAGDYMIEHFESTSYLYFRSTDGRWALDVSTLPMDDVPAKQSECQLVFELRDANHRMLAAARCVGETPDQPSVKKEITKAYDSRDRYPSSFFQRFVCPTESGLCPAFTSVWLRPHPVYGRRRCPVRSPSRFRPRD